MRLKGFSRLKLVVSLVLALSVLAACEIRNSRIVPAERSDIFIVQQARSNLPSSVNSNYFVALKRASALSHTLIVTRNREKIGELKPGETQLVDQNTEDGQAYIYNIKEVNENGSPIASQEIPFKVIPDCVITRYSPAIFGRRICNRLLVENLANLSSEGRSTTIVAQEMILGGETKYVIANEQPSEQLPDFSRGDLLLYVGKLRSSDISGLLNLNLNFSTLYREPELTPSLRIQGAEIIIKETDSGKIDLVADATRLSRGVNRAVGHYSYSSVTTDIGGQRVFYAPKGKIPASQIVGVYQMWNYDEEERGHFCEVSPIDGSLMIFSGNGDANSINQDGAIPLPELYIWKTTDTAIAFPDFIPFSQNRHCVRTSTKALDKYPSARLFHEVFGAVSELHLLMASRGIKVSWNRTSNRETYTSNTLLILQALIAHPDSLANYLESKELDRLEVTGNKGKVFTISNQTLTLDGTNETPAADVVHLMDTNRLFIKTNPGLLR